TGIAIGALEIFEPRSRPELHIEVSARLAGSLLVRSRSAQLNAPDMVHLTEADSCWLPGTGIAGALRARAGRVLHALGCNGSRATFLDDIFGWKMRASKLWVSDVHLPGGT